MQRHYVAAFMIHKDCQKLRSIMILTFLDKVYPILWRASMTNFDLCR